MTPVTLRGRRFSSGGRLRAVAGLHPASAGTSAGPAVIDARRVRVAHALYAPRPAAGWHRKIGGYDWGLYYPSYFLRGFAVHGYPDVPPHPASHGCARIPMWIAQTIYAQIADGSEVIVYS